MLTGWKATNDNRGRRYYYNKQLGKSQYEHPSSDFESPPLPPPPPQEVRTPFFKRSPLRGPSFSPVDRQDKNYLLLLNAERAKLRAMLPHVSGPQKVEVIGDLAALESQIHALRK